MKSSFFILMILLIQTTHGQNVQVQERMPTMDEKSSLRAAYAESAMVVRHNKIVWTGRRVPTAEEQMDFDVASEILIKIGDIVEEGMKVVIRAEGENKAVFFEDSSANFYKYKIVYDPSNNEIIQRFMFQD